MRALLGVDVGSRRIGVAVADPTTGSIRPLTTLSRATPKRDAAVLNRLAAEQGAIELVIGLPLDADGTEGPQALAVRGWAAGVADGLAMPISWQDERCTSQEAERRLGVMRRGRSGGPPSAKGRRSHRSRIDRAAAVLILESALDARVRRDPGAVESSAR